MGSRVRRGGVVVCSLAAVLGVAGSGVASSPAPRGAVTVPPGVAAVGYSARVMPAMPLAPAAGTVQPVVLRRDLEMLFGHHVLLLMDLTRSRLQRRPAAVQAAAAAAVNRNSAEIAAAVGGLYGKGAAQAVRQQWDAHIRALLAYADAVRAKDAAAQDKARQQLGVFEQRLAQLLSSAISSGALLNAVAGPPSKATAALATLSAVHSAVQMHVSMLLAQVDADAAGNPTRSFSVQHAAFGHMIALADTLAAGIVGSGGTPPPDFFSPRRRLQTALGQVLGEHMGVMVATMQAGAAGSADFRATGASLNVNTAALGNAIGTLYGRSAGQRFLALWARHVDALLAYTAASVRADPAGKAAARQDLNRFAVDLATFLATATGGRLPAVQLTSAITMHDEDLLGQLDAYSARDYSRAETIAYLGYEHMFTLAQQLAEAIGNTVAARLPRGGAATGGGGTAPHRGRW